MYFEAVQNAMEQLKTDPSTKLQRELNELDPDKKIRDFLSGKTKIRPELGVSFSSK